MYIQTFQMKNQPAIKLLLWSYLTFASLPDHGWGARCSNNAPTLQQTQVGFGNPPKFIAQVQNNCPVCPIINIHMKCGSFSQALVNPRLLKVLAYNDCVVNAGLPLAPLESFSFNYTHHKYPMQLATWFFQCE